MTDPASIDKYQIISKLGEGNFGTVYHAFDRALMTEKAIKGLNVTDPAEFKKSLEEAQILLRCKHKHIVQINEANVFQVNGASRVVLDLEYIPQGSLEAALRARWISIQEAIRYLRGALLGLEHAHAAGFLHRDIKPGNILLGSVATKLSDFGQATSTAKAAGPAETYTSHLAPEYFRAPATTVQTDIFAAGMTLYRAVSNIADWRGRCARVVDRDRHVRNGTLMKALGFRPWIPASIKRIICKACAPNVAERFDSAQALRQKLDRLRFNVDWTRNSRSAWSGRDASAEYEASVDDFKNVLTIKKNGRRMGSLCQQHASYPAAITALHEHIASTTLK